MYWLMRNAAGGVAGPSFRFVAPFGIVGLPLWVVLLVLGREVLMTALRQRGRPRRPQMHRVDRADEMEDRVQLVWVGSAYFWFWIATAAAAKGWTSGAWHAFENFNGTVGVLTMIGAVVLTFYSLALYLRRYGSILLASAGARRRGDDGVLPNSRLTGDRPRPRSRDDRR